MGALQSLNRFQLRPGSANSPLTLSLSLCTHRSTAHASTEEDSSTLTGSQLSSLSLPPSDPPLEVFPDESSQASSGKS